MNFYEVQNRETLKTYGAKGNTLEEAFICNEEIGLDPIIIKVTPLTDPTAEKLVEAELNLLWRKTWRWIHKQFAGEDQTVVVGWYSTGLLNSIGEKGYLDLIAWQDRIFSEEYVSARQAIIIAQQWVEPDMSLWTSCPKTFSFFKENRIEG